MCWAEPGWQEAAALKGNGSELCILEREVEHPVLSSVPRLCRSMSSTCSDGSGQPKSEPLANEGGFGQQSSVFGNWAPVAECITQNWLHTMGFFSESV